MVLGLTRLMSNENKNASDSTVLHLNKFAPGTPAKDPSSDTGVTVMIQRAAAETVGQGTAPVVPKESGALPPEQMLGAVSYCYAKGVYESEEIERKMMRDTTLREAVHGEVPDARAIRKFRRLNRGAIQQTLEKAFGLLRKKAKPAALPPLPGQPVTTTPASAVGDSTVAFVRREAEDRVQQAAFIDNMSKE
jgi:hypothetical protein